MRPNRISRLTREAILEPNRSFSTLRSEFKTAPRDLHPSIHPYSASAGRRPTRSGDYSTQVNLAQLRNAIDTMNYIQITYKGTHPTESAAPMPLKLRPLHLYALGSVWYLLGICAQGHEAKAIDLRDITGLCVLNRQFQGPTPCEIADLLKTAWSLEARQAQITP